MSDTANQAELASSAEFDARLKGMDEARWLATRYAPPQGRERLVAVYLLHHELLRAAAMPEPMLGKIRIQWWRETLEGVASGGPVRRHDLSLELARVIDGSNVLFEEMFRLLDMVDDVVDDHLHSGGHVADGAHTARHMAAEAAMMRLAGLCLDSGAAAKDLDRLTVCGEALLASIAGLADADARLDAAKAASRDLPAVLWPAVAHIAAANVAGPLVMRWRVFLAVLMRRF